MYEDSNLLFVDYAYHLIENNNKPFVSSAFTDITFNELPIAFAILDLPILPNPTMPPEFSINNKKLAMKPLTNSIIFIKDIYQIPLNL